MEYHVSYACARHGHCLKVKISNLEGNCRGVAFLLEQVVNTSYNSSYYHTYNHIIAIIVILNLHTPTTLMTLIAARAKELRLKQNITQEALAKRSGVSLGTLKKFERTGHISLQSLLRLAIALGVSAEFEHIFLQNEQQPITLDALMAVPKKRKRSRGV